MSRYYIQISGNELFKLLYFDNLRNDRSNLNMDLISLITSELYSNPTIHEIYSYFYGYKDMEFFELEEGEIFVEVSSDIVEGIEISHKYFRDIEVYGANPFIVGEDLFTDNDMIAVRKILSTDIEGCKKVIDGELTNLDLKELSEKVSKIRNIMTRVINLYNMELYSPMKYTNYNKKTTTDKIEASSLLIVNTDKIVNELGDLFTLINRFDKNLYRIRTQYPIDFSRIKFGYLRDSLLHNGFYFKYNAGRDCTDIIREVISLYDDIQKID